MHFQPGQPGHTATELGGGGQSVAEGARVVVGLATIGADGPTGTLQEDAGELRW